MDVQDNNSELLNTSKIDTPDIKCEMDIELEEERLDNLDENYHLKCGEIFLSKDEEFIFNCNICDENFEYFHNFADHALFHQKKVSLSNATYSQTSLKTFTRVPNKNHQNITADVFKNPLPVCHSGLLELAVPMETSASSSKDIDIASNNGKFHEPSKKSLGCVKKGKSFKCLICDEEFLQEYNLRLHSRRCNGLSKQPALTYGVQKQDIKIDSVTEDPQICNKKRVSPIVSPPLPQSRLKCKDCGKEFTKYIMLLAHEKIHNATRALSCNLCNNKKFKTQEDLNFHMKQSHPQLYSKEGNRSLKKIKKPRQFSKLFPKEKQLKINEQTQKIDKPFLCEFCPRSFAFNSTLNRHILNFHKCKFYKKLAEQLKDSQISLPENVNIMDFVPDIGPFHCEFCEKVSKTRVGLISHLRLHTGETPFKCIHCNKSFDCPQKCKRHIDKFHQDDQDYVPLMYKKDSNILAGVGISDMRRSITPTTSNESISVVENDQLDDLEEVLVIDTSESTPSEKLLEGELEPPVFICKYCDKELDTKYSLFLHLRSHMVAKASTDSVDPISIDTCDASNKMEGNSSPEIIVEIETEHQQTILATPVYKCEICEKLLDSNYNLFVHRQSHIYKNTTITPVPPMSIINRNGSNNLERKSSPELIVDIETENQQTLLMQVNYKCEICGKLWDSQYDLVLHKQSHIDEIGKKAPMSPISIADSDESNEIERNSSPGTLAKTKSSKRQYKCEFCAKLLQSSYNLSLHRRLHTGEKPYNCLHCEEKFHSLDKFKRHASREHRGVSPSYSNNGKITNLSKMTEWGECAVPTVSKDPLLKLHWS